jgi:hypothetical protein
MLGLCTSQSGLPMENLKVKTGEDDFEIRPSTEGNGGFHVTTG